MPIVVFYDMIIVCCGELSTFGMILSVLQVMLIHIPASNYMLVVKILQLSMYAIFKTTT